ncbi:MAG: MBOAT family O-acyltransferase [Gammaproteobacteria bacterium]
MVRSKRGLLHQGQTATFFEAWGGALAYNLQVYFDFSGYSDMAIGLSRMFGILLPQNFYSPFKSQSIIEFWQRWHMTLGRVIYQYVFLPFSFFFAQTRILRKKKLATAFVTIILTYLLVGLWHGAGWTFICFGFIQGLFYFINFSWRHFTAKIKKYSDKKQNTRFLRLIYWGITYLSLVISFVVFRAENMSTAISMYSSMIGGHGFSLTEHYFSFLNYLFGLGNYLENAWHWKFSDQAMLISLGRFEIFSFIILLVIVLTMPNTQEIMSKFSPCLDDKSNLYKKSILSIRWQPNLGFAFVTAILLIISYCFILIGQSEFLYFSF